MNHTGRNHHALPESSQAGFTLLELLITLYIAGITASLIFTSYRGLTIGFARQSLQAAQVQQALGLKTRIDGILGAIDSVTAAYGSTLEWKTPEGSTQRLSRQGSTLRYGNTVLAEQITDVAWELETTESGSREIEVLFWSVELDGRRWVGGGLVIGD